MERKTNNLSKIKFLNIDFDFELFAVDKFRPNSSNANIEWDYLLLWLCGPDDEIFIHQRLSAEYIAHVQNYRGLIPRVIDSPLNELSHQLEAFWGNWNYLEIKRTYANKAHLAKIMTEKKIYPNFVSWGYKANDFPPSIDSLYPRWVIRPALSFGGKGIKIFSHVDWPEVRRKIEFNEHGYVLMPWLDRKLDIGTRYDQFSTIQSYLNLVDQKGMYRGSYIPKNLVNTLSSISHDLKKNVPPDILKLGENIASDSFFYLPHRDWEKLNLFQLIEFNMRKSMGQMLMVAPSEIQNHAWLGWFIIDRRDLIQNNNIPWTVHGKGWFLLTTSPIHKRFWSFYLSMEVECESAQQDFNTWLDTHLEQKQDYLFSLFAPKHSLHHFHRLIS